MQSSFSLPPTWGTGGLLAAADPTLEEVSAVFGDLTSQPDLRTTVRPDFRQAPLWQHACPSGTVQLPTTHHVLDLIGSYDETFGRFSKMARKAIRKAERDGVTVDSATGMTYVDDFYDLYQGWVQRRAQERGLPLALAGHLGRRNEPLARLRYLSHSLGPVFRVWVARVHGQVVAAMITLIQGNVALAWRAASDKDLAGPARAMDLLHSRAIGFAIGQGCSYYNMGESGGVESLMRFKSRFGATAREFSGYRVERRAVTALTTAWESAKHQTEFMILKSLSRTDGGPG